MNERPGDMKNASNDTDMVEGPVESAVDVPGKGRSSRLAMRIRRAAQLASRAKARTATADERTKLWAQLQDIYPPYDDYQRTAKGREIPVVVLEPSGPPTT